MPSVDGIVSGFDTTALIQGLSTAYSVPLDFMKGDLADDKVTLDKIAGLSNRLEDLSTAIEALQGDDGLVAFKTSMSAEGAFTATATTGATPGAYTIDVLSLASNETEVSSGVADPAANDLAQGTFSITYQGVTTDITLDGSNNSLDDLAKALDGIDGISAYVLNTRDGTAPYKLVIQGDDTGVDNGITIDTTGLAGGTIPTFSEEVSAADAELLVNNVPVFAEGNTFKGIPGIELDDEAMVKNVQAFVDAYNEVRSFYATNTSFNAEEGISGALVGDSTARRVMDGLSRLVTSEAPVVGSAFTALSQLGIATDRDGSLSLDTDKLKQRLGEDLEGVQALLTDDAGPMGVLRTTIDEVYVDPAKGTLASRKDSIEENISDLELRIERQQVRLEEYVAFMREKFTAMEVAMSQFEGTGQYLAGLFNNNNNK
jgi:flagellar capping protein FliD